jgi:hypothetical protein
MTDHILIDRTDGVHVHAIELHWPAHAWMHRFRQAWPEGSDAYQSYWLRIANGPAFDPAQADRLDRSEGAPGGRTMVT